MYTFGMAPRRSARGQVLVMFVGGLLAIIAATALVVDGGNVLVQQRDTQNAADAAAEAGTVVIAQYLMAGSSNTGATGTCPSATTDPWDLEVCKAVYGSASANQVTLASASYTDYRGDVIGTVGAGTLPSGAQGVRVLTSRQFATYFASAIGIPSFTATTQATAVTGSISEDCQPGMPCALFPITVPYVVSSCTDTSGKLSPGSGPWPYLGDKDTNAGNEAIVPLCKDQNNDIGGGSAGSVGWIDYSTAIGVTTGGTCASQFKDAVVSPCVVTLPFPTWVQTFTGGVGKGGPDIEAALNAYHGDTVQVPLFDGTCKVKPTGIDLGDCPAGQIGVGNNTWYHIPSFAGFKLDAFYIDGNDKKQCNELPGSPFVDSNGSNGCMKGWWVAELPTPGAIDLGPVNPSVTNKLGVQLIR